jgi:hypothetical protein
MAKALEFDIDGIRDRSAIADILGTLEEKRDLLLVRSELVGELRSYLRVAEKLPKRVTLGDAASVSRAQEALHLLQARVDRVLEIQTSSLKLTRSLGRLEILAKQDLARLGVFNPKTTGTAVKQVLEMVLPELVIAQQRWVGLDRLCHQVLQHLGDAKDTVRLQIKLDENANWSRRYSGG